MGQMFNSSATMRNGYLTLLCYENPRRRRWRRVRQTLTYAALLLGAAFGALLFVTEVAPLI
ncbi:hypothetical protein [Algihabitans albus]|uniref:hypothetical protein n=1 Tax=Algihabitans albus TaxID=2164067 RepID=UPI0013C3715E|nr:hypothetical protein [Algihabitans albus]